MMRRKTSAIERSGEPGHARTSWVIARVLRLGTPGREYRGDRRVRWRTRGSARGLGLRCCGRNRVLKRFGPSHVPAVPQLSPNCTCLASTPVHSRRLTPRVSRCLCALGRQFAMMVRPACPLRIPLGTPFSSRVPPSLSRMDMPARDRSGRRDASCARASASGARPPPSARGVARPSALRGPGHRRRTTERRDWQRSDTPHGRNRL